MQEINGHAMALLEVPANTTNEYLTWGVQPFVNFPCDAIAVYGKCFRQGEEWGTYEQPPSTDVEGGHRLRNAKGEDVPYKGQAFLLCVPESALSEKGRVAAAAYAKQLQAQKAIARNWITRLGAPASDE